MATLRRRGRAPDGQDRATLRRSRVVRVAVVAAMAVLAFVGWAIDRGYVFPPTGYSCTDEAYTAVPSFETLVEEYGKSPYCARLHRGETWF